MKEVKDQVQALAEVQLKTHRETLLMRKSLRSCQSRCHVAGQSRWRNLWTAVRNLFAPTSLSIIDTDQEIENEISALAAKLSLGKIQTASAQ